MFELYSGNWKVPAFDDKNLEGNVDMGEKFIKRSIFLTTCHGNNFSSSMSMNVKRSSITLLKS